jgi:hypothetical protein
MPCSARCHWKPLLRRGFFFEHPIAGPNNQLLGVIRPDAARVSPSCCLTCGQSQSKSDNGNKVTQSLQRYVRPLAQI